MRSLNLIIDTNLLLLLIIGSINNGQYISSSNRLNDYGEQDYQAVAGFMAGYRDVFITPYIATEVSNLIDLTGEARKLAFSAAKLIFSQFKEIDTSLMEDSKSDHFIPFGITDSSLIELVADYTILTNDMRLAPLLHYRNTINVADYAAIKYLIKR